MPVTSIVCHCRDCSGRSQPVKVALEHAAKRRESKYTYELLAAMLATVQDRGERISTTTLTSKCLRSETLIRTTDYEQDPDRMYASFRGTMFHGQLERHFHPQAIAEARFHVLNFEGMGAFSGSPDLVDPKAGTLYDYKFTKENPRWDKPWDDHVNQLQVNRWLVDNADYVEWEGDWYPLTEAGSDWLNENVAPQLGDAESERAAARAKFIPIDWQGLYVVYMDDKGPKPLLITRSEQVPKKSGPGTKSARVADIWPDERVEGYIRTKYAAAKKALVDGVVPDIPPGFESWNHPLCGFCPVKDVCIERYIESEVQMRLRRAA